MNYNFVLIKVSNKVMHMGITQFYVNKLKAFELLHTVL